MAFAPLRFVNYQMIASAVSRPRTLGFGSPMNGRKAGYRAPEERDATAAQRPQVGCGQVCSAECHTGEPVADVASAGEADFKWYAASARECLLEDCGRFRVASIHELDQVAFRGDRDQAIRKDHGCPKVAINVERNAVDESCAEIRGTINLSLGERAIGLDEH